ncbi:MAG: glycosyl hydrolase family 28 protein [Bacilli bacterium]|nr:glycosyl hydrolase family 28 protein [Bacilli bacterium]
MKEKTIVLTPDSKNRLFTSTFQKAVDDLSVNGGGTLELAPGEYVLSTVYLRSHVHIKTNKGVKILGALSFYDYEPEEKYDYPLYQDSSHSNFHCSMFVAEGIEDFSFTGEGEIDMRDVWDLDDVRKIKHRGPKIFAIKSCRDFEIADLTMKNATDLAVYFVDSKNVEIHDLKLNVYIDGISPDNCENVMIRDCDVVAGDDCIVFKSTYNLNKFGDCRNIEVKNCRLSSRCNAVKIGTETNGGFYNIDVHDIEVYDTRLSVLAIETVDGSNIDGFRFANVHATNCNGIFYATIGDRLRGPEGIKIGTMKNVLIENVEATGPYHEYDTIYWNYLSYAAKDKHQYLWINTPHGPNKPNPKGSQFISNLSGLPGHPIENMTLRHVHLTLNGGYSGKIKPFAKKGEYPEIHTSGHPLGAKGIVFADIDGLVLDDVTINTINEDARPDFLFINVKMA